MFDTNLTMIPRQQGAGGTVDLSRIPQVGQCQNVSGNQHQAGPSHIYQDPNGAPVQNTRDPTSSQLLAPANSPGLLAVSQPAGSDPNLQRIQTGHSNTPTPQLGPSSSAPSIGSLGPPSVGQVLQIRTSGGTNTTPTQSQPTTRDSWST